MEDDGEPVEPPKVAKKFVSQCGVIVRDNVPISIRKWKSTDPTEEYVLPDTEKEMLWRELKAIFDWPSTHEAELRDWTMKKMAVLFQDFKKKLYSQFLKTGEAPDPEKYKKITDDEWEAFLEYKTSEEGATASARNAGNAANKKYSHKMGSGGYKGSIPKWEKMEEDLYARGITPATHDWPTRTKHWYYGHGGTLSPIDGSLVFPEDLRELAQRLLDILRASDRGEFVADRDRDELTYALGNKEHPGRTRGVGTSVSWKKGFQEHAATYRSRSRKKAEYEQRVRDLEQTVAAQGSKLQEMESEMERRMKVAWLQIQQATGGTGSTEPAPLQQATGGTGSTEHAPLQDAALISPPQQYQSSHASTQAAKPVRYPVDEITQRTACELVVRQKNLAVVVRMRP